LKKRELILIKNIKILLENRFVRFLLAGGINTLFGYGVFSLFIFLKMHYALALLLATVLGVLFNFQTIGRFVFKNNDNKLLFKFVLVYMAVYLVNLGGLKVFNSFEISNYIAGAVLVIPIALLSYLLNKRFIFKESKKD
jgi:putative flippase GtrA